jgi:hypothetical protein
MRRRAFISSLIVLAVAVPLVAAAVVTRPYVLEGKVDRQTFRASSFERTTHGTSWHPISGWGPSDGMFVTARGPVVVALSVQVTGAPAQFRVGSDQGDGTAVEFLQPGGVTIDPGTGKTASSFTLGRRLPGQRHELVVYWRSPTGVDTILQRISLHATFDEV